MSVGDVVEELAGRRQRVLVGLLSIAVLVGIAAILPYAAMPLYPLPHVSGMYGAATAMIDLATFWLLMTAPGRPRSHSIIAAAYLYGGLMAVLHVVTFPGAVIPGAPLFGSPHAVSWLFIAWRAGFACLIAWAVLAHRPGAEQVGASGALPIAVAVLAAAAAFAASQFTDGLASQRQGDSQRFGAFIVYGSYFAAAAAVVANLLIWRRGLFRRSIFVWLVFVMTAEAAAVWLSTFSGGRYTLAWYATRAEGVVANAVVLLLLARHFRQVQRRLAETVAGLQRRTEGLQAEIHRRERAERELTRAEKLKAVGQLGAGLAHDLNNILQVISGRLSLLQRRSGGAADADVEVIRRNVRKAEALTRQLTLLSGRRNLLATPLDVRAALQRVVESARSLLGPAHTLTLRADEGLPAVVLDALEFEIAVTNLVTNARDAMPQGGEITLHAHATPAVLSVEVKDSGTGIKSDIQERIFEPFFTTKAQGRGTGLGLAQVAAFVQGSGAAVHVDSEPARGTCVRMSFPLAPAAPVPDDVGPADASHAVGAGRLVLLVDDDDDVREASEQLFAAAGFAVRTARSGREALALMHDGCTPDLLVSDIVMPGEPNGVDLVREIRRTHPSLRAVLVTGHSDIAQDARNDGLTVVPKPYDFATVLKALGVARGQP